MKRYLLLLALPLFSCERKADSGSLVIDSGLRGLYSVSSISGSFKAPKYSSHYILTTLEFEDGKYARRGPMVSNSIEISRGGSSTAQFLWGEKSGKNATALVSPGSVSRADNEFWRPITTTTSFGDGAGREYDGYKILGMGQSELTRTGIGNMGFGPDLDRALKERMYVGVLVVRFFSSEEEMEKFTSSGLAFPKPESEGDQKLSPDAESRPQ